MVGRLFPRTSATARAARATATRQSARLIVDTARQRAQPEAQSGECGEANGAGVGGKLLRETDATHLMLAVFVQVENVLIDQVWEFRLLQSYDLKPSRRLNTHGCCECVFCSWAPKACSGALNVLYGRKMHRLGCSRRQGTPGEGDPVHAHTGKVSTKRDSAAGAGRQGHTSVRAMWPSCTAAGHPGCWSVRRADGGVASGPEGAHRVDMGFYIHLEHRVDCPATYY
jgi:hypothetical protein